MAKFSSKIPLVWFLDPELSYNEHIQCILTKACKISRLIRRLQSTIPRTELLTSYKSFFRPHPFYGDVICDHSFNESFQNKLESVQYNTALDMTGAIRGSSSVKRYEELGFESLKSRRLYRKLCLFFKLKRSKHPLYLVDITPKVLPTRLPETITTFLYLMLNLNTSKSLFFHPVIDSNILENNVQNSKSVLLVLLHSSDQFPKSNPHGIKLLTRLSVGLSHFHEHKFKHNLQDSREPFCYCGRHSETTIHFFLHCSNYSYQRKTLFDSIMVETLVFGPNGVNEEKNAWIMKSTIAYVITTQRFIIREGFFKCN